MIEALSPYRVVELGGGVAAAYCGKLFADFGATVTKVEPLAGDPLRTSEDLYFGWLNTNKRSVAAALEQDADARAVQALIAGADVLVDARPLRRLSSGPLAHDTLRRLNPRLVIVAVSWFGETGPYRDYCATDATCWAWAGLTRLVGPREGPLMTLPGHPAQIIGGTSAFTAAMAGLMGRAGGARRFELSIHEACVTLAEYQVALGAAGVPAARLGLNRYAPTYPLGIFECREGWLGITVVTHAQWQSFCSLFGMDEAAAHPDYQLNLNRVRDADRLEPQFATRLKARSAEEWFEIGRRLKLPFVIVPDMGQLLAQDVHRRRGAFVPVRVGGRSVEGPALPQRLTATPARRGGQAPALGARVAGDGRNAGACLAVPPASDALPLAGVRILDLSMGWAGPLVTRQLADLGAEILKVESCRYPDWWRGTDFSDAAVAGRQYETRPPFLMMNRNKTGITLDLSHPRGAAMLKALAARADAVVENYSQGVLPRLGLDYPALSERNASLVMMSMPAFGCDSEWRDVRAYGSTLEQASGLPTLVGLPDWPPTSAHLALGDPVGGLTATAALLAALDHRRRTGRGQHVDISQVECMLPLAAHAILEQSATGRAPERAGNRDPAHVPQGCFRCAGEDEWLFVSVADDAQWRSLCAALRWDAMAADAGLAGAQGRRGRQDRIEAELAAWAGTRGAQAAAAHLQAHAVCAAVVVSPFDLPRDAHLRERGFWQTAQRAIAGSDLPQAALPFRQSGAPYALRTPAPLLGQSTLDVLREYLDLDDAALADLREAGVIGETAVSASQRRARTAA